MVPQAGLEPAKTWLLRPVAVPICISHQGMVVVVGIDPTSSPYEGGTHPSTSHNRIWGV